MQRAPSKPVFLKQQNKYYIFHGFKLRFIVAVVVVWWDKSSDRKIP